ncbi:PQQ-binding-like beta-propeller repeat protein [Paenibacillus puldeungensis]|uniref:PQQ-binding-like beta-propeller repeat protein n=1 Tax=Paenibacillus puldeungensis TaxID=696536 RepID=A0ABW3S253_9BACL
MLRNGLKWTIIAGLSLTLAASTASAADYVQPNHSYSGYSLPSYLNKVPVAKPIWSTNLGHPSESYRYGADRVAVGEGTIFYLKNGKLVAANAKTGKTIWTYGEKLLTQVIYQNGTILVSDTNGRVYMVSAKTGTTKWKSASVKGQSVFSFAFDKDTVYANTNKGILAYDKATGKLKWSNGSVLNSGSMMVVDDKLLASTWESGALTVDVTYAINKQTGKTLWRAGSIPSPLLIKDGYLYSRDTWPPNDSNTYQYPLSVIELSTGKAVEERQYIKIPEGQDALSTQVYTSATDGQFLFIQANNAIFRYDYRKPGDEQQPKTYQYNGKWIAGPYNNKLFFEKEYGGGIQAIKVLNDERVDYEGLDNPVSRLDFYNSGMFVGQTDGEIYALNVITGKALFRYQTQARSFEAFHIEDGVLIAQADDSLYAFKIPAQLLQPLPTTPIANVDYVNTDAKITINGKVQTLKLNPIMIQNQIYVPLQAVAEALGAKVQHDAATGATTIVYKNQNLNAPEGEAINQITYVKIGDFGKLLGISVVWDQAARSVNIDTSKS